MDSKFLRLMVIAFGLWSAVFGVPLTPADVTSNDLESDDDEDVVGVDDDFTTHALEHLSSAATCLVAGVEYTHGQQIYRIDPCEFCLCLDGEMFCWWQDCPPTMEGPCKERGPFTPCSSVVAHPSSQTPAAAKTASNGRSIHETSSYAFVENSTNPNDNTTFSETNEYETSTNDEANTTVKPKFCTIMGKIYRIGDKLPHTTGNCIECICGQGAKVTCSPHQCAPAGDDDYRPIEPRQQLSDVF